MSVLAGFAACFFVDLNQLARLGPLRECVIWWRSSYIILQPKKKKGIETNKIINTQINQPLSVCYQVDLGVPLNCTLQIAYLQIY